MYEGDRSGLWSQRVSRRHLLAGALGLTASALLAACGGDDDDDTSDSTTASTEAEATESETEAEVEQTETEAATAGQTETSEPAESATEAPNETEPEAGATGFEFTDGTGQTITLDRVPERIVAEVGSAAALWDFGIRPVGYFGLAVGEDGSREPTAGNLDLDSMTSIGQGFEDFDVEALLALEPDLIVTTIFVEDSPWAINAEVLPQVREIAPLAVVSLMDVDVTSPIHEFEELAGKLGADLESAEVTTAKARFEAAGDQVRVATEENPGLSVLVVGARDDGLYIASPATAADLRYYQELGVELVVPDVQPGQWWETLSWEQALKYPADLILNDIRTGSYTIEQLMAVPSMAEHPAVKAGQVAPWSAEYVASYQGFSQILEDLAATLEESRADVV